jgi:tetratricopeptide (TPR) repeat protein
MHKKRKSFWFGLAAVVIAGTVILFLPPVWSRVTYHAQDIYTKIKYKLNPPADVIFVPEKSTPNAVETAVQATLAAMRTPTPQSTATPVEFTATPTQTPIPLPAYVYLKGVKQEMEEWNNCGPTTLSMNLSYWGWSGSQNDIAPIVKPNSRDKNVMPYELEDYITNNTDFQALVRIGGDMQTLKALVNAGIPVIIEKGFSTTEQGWMGHYELVVGYDDEKQQFLTQDSYLQISKPDSKYFTISYADFYQNWRAFNFVFLVVYPQNKQNDVMNLLGPLWDETTAFQVARDRALSETTSLTDTRDLFFAWFNLGSSDVKQQNYSDAALAYDKAFSILPNIDTGFRPWRMMWYQTGPYYAYYYTARYADVIKLASNTLDAMSEPVLEESYYWRALSEDQLGERDSAIADLQTSLKEHSGFPPSVAALQQMGVTP